MLGLMKERCVNMAKHEFGLMPRAPLAGERYDVYEPYRYHCITVDDEIIEKLCRKTADIKVYWHTLDCPAKGLAYCGITLIPPETAGELLAAADGISQLAALRKLLRQARRQSRFMIHFGI